MPLGTLSRQSMTGLALAAGAGVVIGEWVELPLWPFVGLVLAISLGTWWWKGTTAVMVMVVAAFAVLHSVHHWHHPARRLAAEVGAGQRPAVAAGIVVTEPEATPDRRGQPASRFLLRCETLELADEPQPTGVEVLVRWLGPPPAYGDRVRVAGSLANLRGARNPGEFDHAAQMQREGVYSLVIARQPDEAVVLAHGLGNPLVAWSHRARDWMQRALTLGLEDAPEAAGLIQNMVLGLKHETPEAVREAFQKTGTIHVLVVSGLHVGMFAALAFFAARMLRFGRHGAVLITIPVLIFYVLVTGPRPSSIRAGIMTIILLSAILVERPALGMNTLAAAAFAILLWDTEQLFAPGAQFSFAVVLAIIMFSGRIQRLVGRLWSPDPFLPRLLWRWNDYAANASSGYVGGLLGVSFAAWIGALIFTVRFFHLVSPAALIANLFAVLLAFAIIALGIASLVAASVSTWLATLFNNANWLAAQGLLALVQGFARLPGGHVYVEVPPLRAPPACEVTVFDLGAGGAVHVRAGAQDWLLDPGGERDFDGIVLPYLRTRGVNRLDGLLISHGDTRHMGGAVAAAESFRPRRIVDSPQRDSSPARRDLHTALAAQDLGKEIHWRGDVARIAPEVTLEVLYPPADFDPRSSDDKGFVLRLEAAGRRVLFVFDAGFITERWLLDHAADLRAEVLVRGQHGSDISGMMDFIAAVGPRAVVVACADFPEMARLSEEWVASVRERGIELYRQDESGAVRIELRPEQTTILEFLPAQKFRTRSR